MCNTLDVRHQKYISYHKKSSIDLKLLFICLHVCLDIFKLFFWKFRISRRKDRQNTTMYIYYILLEKMKLTKMFIYLHQRVSKAGRAFKWSLGHISHFFSLFSFLISSVFLCFFILQYLSGNGVQFPNAPLDTSSQSIFECY